MGQTTCPASVCSNKSESLIQVAVRVCSTKPPVYRSQKTRDRSYFAAADKRIWQFCPLREPFQNLLLPEATDWNVSDLNTKSVNAAYGVLSRTVKKLSAYVQTGLVKLTDCFDQASLPQFYIYHPFSFFFYFVVYFATIEIFQTK